MLKRKWRPLAGERHPRAKLLDVEVDCIRLLHSDGAWGYVRLAVAFRTSKSTVAKICRCERRLGVRP